MSRTSDVRQLIPAIPGHLTVYGHLPDAWRFLGLFRIFAERIGSTEAHPG